MKDTSRELKIVNARYTGRLDHRELDRKSSKNELEKGNNNELLRGRERERGELRHRIIKR